MKNKIAAVLLIVSAMSAAAASCGGKKSSSIDLSSSNDEISATTETTTSTVTSADSTKTTTSAATVTTPPTTEKSTGSPIIPGGNQSGCTDLAIDFYQAYLDHQPEKVYKMFNPEEIRQYREIMADELDGMSPDEVFSEEKIIKAIDDSMYMIEEIMTEYSDSPEDRWSVDITDDLLTSVEDDAMSDFNDELGLDYSNGAVLHYMFYVNEDNGNTFIGNSSAYVEKNGSWYLSFSSLMQSELIDQMEV